MAHGPAATSLPASISHASSAYRTAKSNSCSTTNTARPSSALCACRSPRPFCPRLQRSSNASSSLSASASSPSLRSPLALEKPLPRRLRRFRFGVVHGMRSGNKPSTLPASVLFEGGSACLLFASLALSASASASFASSGGAFAFCKLRS